MEIKYIIALIVGVIATVWKATQYFIERRDKKNEIIETNNKNEEIENYYRLVAEVKDRWHTHTIMELTNRFAIEGKMLELVQKRKANYVHFISAKNGGDHITARKNYTATVLYEKHNTSKPPKYDDFQNIRVGSQLSKIFLDALTENYVYYENFEKTMEDGEIKRTMRMTDGSDLAWYYIGRIGIEHYFLFFQFSHAGGNQTLSDREILVNICSNFYYMLKEAEDYKDETEIKQKEVNNLKKQLKKEKLI